MALPSLDSDAEFCVDAATVRLEPKGEEINIVSDA